MSETDETAEEAAEKAEDSNQTEEKAAEQVADAAQSGGAEQAEASKDARNMAMLCHLLAIFTSFIAPLIIWLIKKDEEPFVDQHGKEALNFQITVILAMFVSGLLTVICIGFPLMFAVSVIDLIFCIIATVKASSGETYRYPLAIRFLK
ncbi:MAG: DUF4870 domain-containing protein [Planctomycetota bacterium]|jgi:uncharacterized Tic20 family protein